MDIQFTMKDGHGYLQPLQRLEVDEGEETLGVYILMDRNYCNQENNLRSVCKNFGNKMRTNKHSTLKDVNIIQQQESGVVIDSLRKNISTSPRKKQETVKAKGNLKRQRSIWKNQK